MMKLEYNDISSGAVFKMYMHTVELSGKGIIESPSTINTFVLNKGSSQTVVIDEIPYNFPAQSILPLMYNQHFVFEDPENLVAWQFNRDFYCIMDHDEEVGCVGFLFYGIQQPLFVKLNDEKIKAFLLLEKNIREELLVTDNYQGEMLRSLLKRFIIKSTRIGKEQSESYSLYSNKSMDTIREFSLLVEANFRREHSVQFYAKLLHKSPKTLSNLFAKSNQPSPLKIIHNRIIMEVKRYLYYTTYSSKKIAYELGFENPEHFSRFFRHKTGINVTNFKKNIHSKIKL